MSSTLTATGFDAVAEPTIESKPGIFQSIYSGIMAGQEARARAIVRRHMEKYDDAQLEALGWSKAEIAALRTR
jgi:hypothetical protein